MMINFIVLTIPFSTKKDDTPAYSCLFAGDSNSSRSKKMVDNTNDIPEYNTLFPQIQTDNDWDTDMETD